MNQTPDSPASDKLFKEILSKIKELGDQLRSGGPDKLTGVHRWGIAESRPVKLAREDVPGFYRLIIGIDVDADRLVHAELQRFQLPDAPLQQPPKVQAPDLALIDIGD